MVGSIDGIVAFSTIGAAAIWRRSDGCRRHREYYHLFVSLSSECSDNNYRFTDAFSKHRDRAIAMSDDNCLSGGDIDLPDEPCQWHVSRLGRDSTWIAGDSCFKPSQVDKFVPPCIRINSVIAKVHFLYSVMRPLDRLESQLPPSLLEGQFRRPSWKGNIPNFESGPCQNPIQRQLRLTSRGPVPYLP